MTTEVGTPEVGSSALTLDATARRSAAIRTLATIAGAMLVFGPILYHMVNHWRTSDDYSHGFLIAPLAVYFAWERRGKLKRTRIEPTWWGLVPLALGALALTVGRLGVQRNR